MTAPLPFIPGRSPNQASLLARFLPPVPEGVVEAWLSAQELPPGAWLLDPFGSSPGLAVEAARAGCRVVVACNNPVARFLLELSACPPLETDLTAALAELADSRRGEERLEQHLRSLYQTTCAQCRRPVEAQAFLWEKGAPAPYARLYHCPYCGDSGERPASEQDAARAARFSAGPHRARALERIAPAHDPDRAFAEEALETYLPRSLYAVVTLVNRLEGLLANPDEEQTAASPRRRSLLALALSALDQANSLWHYPVARARPRQLSSPPRFRENNLWQALEEAANQLASPASPLPLVSWPASPPPSGGIAVFEGRLKELARRLEGGEPAGRVEFAAAFGAFPRPNQAFWTLSALWSGWLWGREAIGPFKSVLRRRRYDWGWHATALQAALEALRDLLPPGAPFFGLVSEAEAGFLIAALVSARGAVLELQGMALRTSSAQAQVVWRRASGQDAAGGAQLNADAVKRKAAQAAQDHLRQRAEPAGYLSLLAASLLALVEEFSVEAGDFSQVQDYLEEALSAPYGFFRLPGERQTEASHWWNEAAGSAFAGYGAESLADRVEKEVVRFLLAHPGCSVAEVEGVVCRALPGLLTPRQELIERCIESYGEKNSAGQWSARPAESPAARRADISAMRKITEELGARLGFTPQGEKPVLWLEPSGEAALAFYPQASAAFSQLLESSAVPADRAIIVLPGARASLAVYKLRRDPRLARLASAGWRFLKFRHLRALLENPTLTIENLDEQLALDPLTESIEQMRLL
jgi:hypothetical protein